MIHQAHQTVPPTSVVPPIPPSRQSIPLLGQIRNNNSSGGSTSTSTSFNDSTTTCEIQASIVTPQSSQQHQSASRLIKSKSETSSVTNGSSCPSSSPPSSLIERISAKSCQQQPLTTSNNDNSPVVYGELVILGYNGCLPQGEKGRRRSKYQLVRRVRANGIKKSKHYSVKQPQTSKAIQDKDQHSISFTLSRSQAIIVEYQHDEETDMFQIGRSSESPIDFVVIDTIMLEQQNRCLHAHSNDNCVLLPSQPNVAGKVVQQSTISRFACRILVDRKPPYCARIYAAGFDSSKNIFLGEKATKWQTNGEIDGLTTNGILIMHPKQPFINKMCSDNANSMPISCDSKRYPVSGSAGGIWREVSVCGEIYSVRETRSASQKGIRIENETNVLQDGTLIDLCGATLMWRSSEGLIRSPTKRHLEEMIDQLNASRPQCPVGLNTLVIPRKSASLGAADDKQPYVYLKCGHVQGYHDWGQNKHSNSRTCPMCFKSGPIVKLTMGIEPSFCTSSGPPNYGFNPCGHMASESTVKYWSQVLIPHGTNGFHAMCPFCAIPLQGDLGYVKLIFQ